LKNVIVKGLDIVRSMTLLELENEMKSQGTIILGLEQSYVKPGVKNKVMDLNLNKDFDNDQQEQMQLMPGLDFA
jgi:hypothetical protein